MVGISNKMSWTCLIVDKLQNNTLQHYRQKGHKYLHKDPEQQGSDPQLF